MKRLTWILTLAVILLPVAAAVACPMCKDSIPNSDAEKASAVPLAFNFSIYYMLCGFFISLGLAVGVITKGIKNADRRIER